MRHTILTTLLTLGVVFGLAYGFHERHHGHHHGWNQHSRFKDHVADICVEAALRTVNKPDSDSTNQ